MLIGSAISGGTMLITHTVAPSTLATTYTAENSDIKGAENDYRALEAELSTKVNDLESNYPGYSSYELNAGQIGHDPYKLAALLTVLHDDYKREDVQDDLKRIFETQYNLSMHDEAGSSRRKPCVSGSLSEMSSQAATATAPSAAASGPAGRQPRV